MGGNDTWSPLARGAGAKWVDGADGVDDPPFLVAVAAAVAVADDVAGPDDPLLAGAEPGAEPEAAVGLDDPPHAASSRTNEAIPVAAANPLLRIKPLQFTGMTRSPGQTVQGLAGRAGHKRSRAVIATGPGTLEPSA